MALLIPSVGNAKPAIWKEFPPPTRFGHAAIYDPVRDRMIFFGGSDSEYRGDIWICELGDGAAWSALPVAGGPPTPRSGHSAVYDPVGDRMIVFGGLNSALPEVGHGFNDIWALSLSDPPRWTLLVAEGEAPGTRSGHVAVYDSAQHRMLVFGGIGAEYLSDVWALSLDEHPSWTRLPTTSAPPATHLCAAIYDPVGDRMIVNGGLGGPSGTWSLALSGEPVWTQLAGANSPGGYGHSAIYDAGASRLILLTHGATWQLSLDGYPEWTRVLIYDSPLIGRSYAAAIYDALRNRVIVHGGIDAQQSVRGDAWVMKLVGTPTWNALAPSPSPVPSDRASHAAVFDAARDRMIVFGGYGGTGPKVFGDVWEMRFEADPLWRLLTPDGSGPSARQGASAILDEPRDRMIVFGGRGLQGVELNDTWAFQFGEPPTWTPLQPDGTSPAPRAGHSATYDPVRRRMIVFGGDGGLGERLNDTWSLSLDATPTWTMLAPSRTPPAGRLGHSAVFDPTGDRLIVFGGVGAEFYEDTWALSLDSTLAWRTLAPGPPLWGHTAVYDPLRGGMVVFGGTNDRGLLMNGTWVLNLIGPLAWERVQAFGDLAAPRASHSAIYDRSRARMVVFGGASGGIRNDTWSLALTRSPEALGISGLDASAGVSEIEVRWSVRSRQAFAGFNVLRSDPDSPDRTVTEHPVRNAAATYPATLSWTDYHVRENVDYTYAIEVIYSDGAPEVWDRHVTARVSPSAYRLEILSSNPFRAGDVLNYRFSVPKPGGDVAIELFDASGGLVASLLRDHRETGEHALSANGAELDRLVSGVYFLRLAAGGTVVSRKFIIIR